MIYMRNITITTAKSATYLENVGQGDFVSYTWPDLMQQAGGLAKAAILGQLHYIVIAGLAAIVAIVALAI